MTESVSLEIKSAFSHLHAEAKTVYYEKTKFQIIHILEIQELGRALLLDGQVQCAEVDEYVYHSSIVHPLFRQGIEVKDVLILGGGDLCAARECLIAGAKYVTIMDIDQRVVEACIRYIPSMTTDLRKEESAARIKIIHDDARLISNEFSPSSFDAIICDLTDDCPIVNKELFGDALKLLRDGGVISCHAGSGNVPFVGNDKVLSDFKEVFPNHYVGVTYGMTSMLGSICILIGGKKPLSGNFTPLLQAPQ